MSIEWICCMEVVYVPTEKQELMPLETYFLNSVCVCWGCWNAPLPQPVKMFSPRLSPFNLLFYVLFANFRKTTFSIVMYVRLSAWNNSVPTGGIFMKLIIWVFFENLLTKFKFHYNLTRIRGTLHEDQCTFLILCSSFLFRMRNIAGKICRQNPNTHSNIQ